MDRGIVRAGIGVLVAGMVMFGLGLYLDMLGVQLLIFGGLIMVLGLTTLGAGGAVKSVGVLLLVVGISGTVFGIVWLYDLLPGISLGTTGVYVLGSGFWGGPILMGIGLGLIYVSSQRRGRAVVSA